MVYFTKMKTNNGGSWVGLSVTIVRRRTNPWLLLPSTSLILNPLSPIIRKIILQNPSPFSFFTFLSIQQRVLLLPLPSKHIQNTGAFSLSPRPSFSPLIWPTPRASFWSSCFYFPYSHPQFIPNIAGGSREMPKDLSHSISSLVISSFFNDIPFYKGKAKILTVAKIQPPLHLWLYSL